MVAIAIDGNAKTITLNYVADVTDIAADDIYSEWKRWVADGNAQFLPAFSDAVGGNPLGGGVSLAGYYFLRNDLGWRLTHENYNYEIRISGDLYPADPSGSMIQHGVDPYAVTFVLQRSAASYLAEVGTSGLTPTESAQLTSIDANVGLIQTALNFVIKILRNRRETDPVAGKQRIYDDDSTTVLLEGDLFEDISGTQPYQGQGAERADKMV